MLPEAEKAGCDHEQFTERQIGVQPAALLNNWGRRLSERVNGRRCAPMRHCNAFWYYCCTFFYNPARSTHIATGIARFLTYRWPLPYGT